MTRQFLEWNHIFNETFATRLSFVNTKFEYFLYRRKIKWHFKTEFQSHVLDSTGSIIEKCLRPSINYLCFDFASLERWSAEFEIQIVMKLKISYFVSLISRLGKLPKYKINVNPNLENVENFFINKIFSCLRGCLRWWSVS